MAQIDAAKPDTDTGAAFDAVHADILRHFPELVASFGRDPARLLQQAGLDAASLSAGAANYRWFVDLLEYAAAELHCPDFGLRLATRQGGGSVFGPMGVVMMNSNTLGEALDYVRKHFHAHSLAARLRFEPRPECGGVLVAHDILLDRLPNKQQAIEQLLLLGHLNAVEITGGRARARQVLFRHQALSSLSSYRRYFGCEVRFDQASDGIVFSERDLACPIVSADARLYAAATSLIDKTFTRLDPPMHAQVRGVLLEVLGTEHCSNEQVASELHLHPRTLLRRLKDEGTSFQAVKDAVRRDVAQYYLQQTKLDLTQIAQRLGYAEHSVLTRSCIRWFAASPRQVRLRQGRMQP
jgi:AraC-like DNA-binding protein